MFSDLMSRGGPVMWPLLICSILTVLTAAERLFAFACILRRGFSRRFVEAARARPGKNLSAKLEEEAQTLIAKLNTRLSVLDTVVTLAPMLGILGTVTGIIGSFNLLSDSGVGGTDPSAVSSGIAEALITTAAGLIVSMCALVPFNFFRARVIAAARELESAAHYEMSEECGVRSVEF